MSALVETTEGEWRIIYYNEWLAQQQTTPAIMTTETPSFFPNLTPELV
jgi:hypothetical protein